MQKYFDQTVPFEIQRRYDELIAKRQQETLTPQEYDELLNLTAQVEKLGVERMYNLAELARFRGLSLDELFAQLGIHTPACT